MRPQLFTAEYPEPPKPTALAAWGFNEAAALHCGIHQAPHLHAVRQRAASMRPQLFTAEYNNKVTLAGTDQWLQ